MTFIPGTTYDVFVTTGQAIFIGETSDPNNPPPPVPGDFNLEVIITDSAGNDTPAAGYQGLAYLSTNGKSLTAWHGDYGIVDSGGNDRITLGDGNTSVLGAVGDTLLGGSGQNQFLDGHLGNENVSGRLSVIGGVAAPGGNLTIWGGPGDTLDGGAYGNATIGSVPGDSIFAGNGNVFIDASTGSATIQFNLSGQTSIWGGPGDLIASPFFTSHVSATVGGAPGDTIAGGALGGSWFVDGSQGNQSITGGALSETIWGGPGDTIHGGGFGGNETIAGVRDTIFGGGDNEFIDGSRGNEFITGGIDRNETIWGALTDTITGGSAGNETIAGVSGETITGGAANIFFDATSGNESILAGGGNSTVWGGAHDTVQGLSGGSALIGFAGGNETFWDDGGTTARHDSISTFSQAGGDRVSLNSATDPVANVVSSAVTDGSGNTTVTLHDGSTITFIGLDHVNGGFFTTH
jgi:hypothetical protein